ncbi:MAG TPA: hypothetical protein PLP19_06845 [bacterium]|nr:hypothetical protein [bacterium]HPN43188.1 hypothetical protein [bacterium]
MRVERIKAPTMREALNKIRIKLGDDAVVLHSRSVKDGIEVIAARDSEQIKTGNTWLDEVIKRDKDLRAERKTNDMTAKVETDSKPDLLTYNRTGQQRATEPEQKNYDEKDIQSARWDILMADDKEKKRPDRPLSHLTIEQLEQATQQAADFSQVLHQEMKNEDEQRKLWLDHEKKLDAMKQELVELKESLLRQELRELQQRAAALKKHKAVEKIKPATVKKPLSGKQVIEKIKATLTDKGFSREQAMLLCNQIQTGIESLDLKFSNAAHVQIIKNILGNEIKKMIPVFHSAAGNDKQKIIAVFGPPEAGKTTTAIKLALQASIINDKKTALILISDSESTTLQHLGKLSSVAKLPLAIVSEPEELAKLLHVHADKDLIVIDYALTITTPENIDLVNRFLAISENIETNLVLPADSDIEQIDKFIKLYKKLNYCSIILTRFDAVKKPGRVVGILQQFSKPLSFICNGQTIPDDIEIANATKLTHMILKG